MIVLLYEAGCETYAERAAQDIADAYGAQVPAVVQSADSATAWPHPPAHDDLLIVFFASDDLPATGRGFVDEYLRRRPAYGLLLPVATSAKARVPPAPANEYKALQYDAHAAGKDGHLNRRVGAMLGYRLQGRDARIFLSHRATDGAHIARQLEAHLTTLGYRPYLDQARDVDGDTKILPGTRVQKEIEQALTVASLVLLIDTPDAPRSEWIRHEVDTANAIMLPVLPICFRAPGDGRGPRFRSLLSLQRWEEFPLPGNTENPLSDSQLEAITFAAEQFLCEIFSRRCRVPFLVRDVFESKGFAWDVIDERQLMYRSSRKQGLRAVTRVLSHCSIFEKIYTPALNRFREYLGQSPWANHSLYIYDGPLLPESELTEIYDPDGDERFVILHHQELAKLIHSNFATLEGP